ncbi:MAG: LacI family DNA-binding transcriptional regulator [Acidobacteriota bacterium]
MKVTIHDIARECGVNVSTVSRSLSGSYGVNDETRQKVLEVARRLNYVPNRVARGLATGRSQSLALLISDIRNPFFAEVARGAEDAAFAAGYDLILGNADLDRERQMRYLRSLVAKRVDGLIINSVSGLSEAEVDELLDYGIPIVLLNRSANVQSISTVSGDNFEGGFLAGQYLIGLGHRNLAHLSGPRHHGNLTERARGFLKAVHQAGDEVHAVVLHGDQNQLGGYQMTRKLLASQPGVTGISTANDAMAFGVIRALLEQGKKIPADISLVGFDNLELAAILQPPLTTIHQPKYEMGEAAVQILLRQIARPDSGPEHRVLGVQLVERESCRKAD